MNEDFGNLLQAAQAATAEGLDVKRIWHRLVNDLESEADLFVPVADMQAALACLSQRGQLNMRLQQAVVSFVQRTGLGDYAVAFNAICEDGHDDLYVELPQTIVCQPATEQDIATVKPYGLYYVRRRLSELWAAPEVSPPHVADVLEAYLREFKKARASDEHVRDILQDMHDYGYLDELCHITRASRTRSACEATAEAKKVVAAEQEMARQLNEAEFALVSFLTEKLSIHKTICLRSYNAKEQNRQARESAILQKRNDEDRDEYGQILRRSKPVAAETPLEKPDTTDLAVLKRPYWLYCEKDNEQYWVGDKAYHDVVISYTSETARKLRFQDDPDWRKVDLDIAHGRLHSFKWHSPVETFIEVQRSGALAATSSPRNTETPIVQRRVGYTLESIADRLLQEQDTVMRASPIGTTLISGAAGSGKTNIAIHRIDYLIQEHAERFSQYNIAVFAPKTSLTKYLRALVDSFGFRLLPTYSYDEWTVEILSNFTDVNGIGAEEDIGLAQRKSAAVMVDLMRRYLSDKTYQLETDIRSDPRLRDYADVLDRTFEKTSPTLIGLYEAIRDALWEKVDKLHAQDAALVQADRRSVESALANALSPGRNQEDLVDILERIIETAFHAFPGFKKEYSSVKTRLEIYRPPLSQDRRNAWRRAASEHMLALQSVTAQFVDLMYTQSRIEQLVARWIKAEKNRVAARVRAAFKRSCSVAIYTHPPTRLVHVCNTPFQLHVLPFLTEFYRSSYCWDYLGLAETPEYPFGVFELTRADVDIVMWFLYQLSRDNLANEPTSNFLHVYDHIVVDEAQDFTPLQLLLLRRLSRNSTTLAGDLTQRIFPTGMQDWAELGEPIDNHFVLTMSHRTTLETALFANALMQDASSATLTERVAYHGDRPLVARVSDEEAAAAAAVSYIAAVKKREPKASILLVHTRNAALKGLRDRLATADLTGYVAKGDTWEFGQKVTVTTYRRIQGLEYDYVVVLALNDFDTMLISGDKSRILYTLATRAKKRLVFYVTEPLPTLLAKVDSSLYELD